MTEAAIPEPNPEQAAMFARVRRMMLIAGATTGIAVAAVLFAVGYRLYRSEPSVTTAASADHDLRSSKKVLARSVVACCARLSPAVEC